MRAILKVIDSISEWTGKIARWFWIVVVLVMTFEVTMRYGFNHPTMWAYETSMMAGAVTYALAFTYTHKHRAHVRVDVLYAHLSPRSRAIIDVAGTALLFFPLIVLLASESVEIAWRAWVINEKSVETYWYPPIAPVRTALAIGLTLFLLQGGAQFFRDLYLLIRNKLYD